MKLLAFLVIASVAACVKSDIADVMRMVKDCQAKVGASDDDIASMMKHEPITNEPQMCMVECLLTAEGMLKDGMISKDGMVDFISKVTGGDAEKIGLAGEVYEECKDIVGTGCETAAKQGTCMREQGEKRKVVL